MDDNLILNMEGRWYLQYSGCPLWIKEKVQNVTFNFSPKHQGEELVLLDRVEYIKNGKMRFKLGMDYPVEGIEKTFRWKGRGVNRTFRNHFEVTMINSRYMVLFFEKTLTSPTAIDILTRQRLMTQELKADIFQAIENNWTIREYLPEVREMTRISDSDELNVAP